MAPEIIFKQKLTNVFVRVREHLLSQKKRSVGAFVEMKRSKPNEQLPIHCRLRGDNESMCAIGCLLEDKNYSGKLEAVSLKHHEHFYHHSRQGVLWDALYKSGIDCYHDMKSLLAELQSIHDTISPDMWEQELNKLKIQFKIEDYKIWYDD